jgi:hypothetical protein
VVQARDIFGDLHVHKPGLKPPVPQQLPLAPRNFVNRKDVIGELDRVALRQEVVVADGNFRETIFTLIGPAGVGKTALAVYWAHRAKENFPDGSLYIDMEGFSAGTVVEPAAALASFLRALGVSNEDMPSSLADRASLFRSMTFEREMIVVVDNVNSTRQVRPLIPANRRCLVLVTSRNRLSGLAAREAAVQMELKPLSMDESIELLRHVIGTDDVARDAIAARRLAALCGQLPLTLRIVST